MPKQWKTLSDLKKELQLKEKNDYDPVIETFFINDGLSSGSFSMNRDVSGEYFLTGDISLTIRTEGKVEKENVKKAYSLFVQSLKSSEPAGGVVSQVNEE